ncbi:UPF0280 family protein [Proteiniborus sp. MB09-C3]|uniref:UPF0280 family protein n=1 Tax=Proteiniborus sp. MB09-C3 TaxID=3050072 RepID=UPI002557C389|nr:UPF0280 family protein [Proteiniborus sp. MB09-C3]WIV11964.1 UPF0280 family protein [Proteiniborus sp. MB09-C3]
MIEKLQDERIFINHGPIQMVIDVSVKGKRMPEIGLEAGKHVLEQFDKLIQYIPKLKIMRAYENTSDEFPEVLNKMIIAVEKSGYKELNTLGAVAGSFSDIALQKAIELGGTRAIVNNGGDIALKDLEGKPIKVGIPYTNDNEKGQLVLTITEEQDIHGICTSGTGGRSFTKGIATAAVALASDAATADACATYLGNMTYVEDENIIRCLAEEIDSGTDIKGQLVTLKVGKIGEDKKYKALLNGLNVAEDLYNKGIIKGAIISIGNTIVKYPDSLLLESIKL